MHERIIKYLVSCILTMTVTIRQEAACGHAQQTQFFFLDFIAQIAPLRLLDNGHMFLKPRADGKAHDSNMVECSNR